MPWWEILCPHCHGLQRDSLFECFPPEQLYSPPCCKLMMLEPGVAFACVYCDRPIGFGNGRPERAEAGWPVMRYSSDGVARRKALDDPLGNLSLGEWYTQVFLDPARGDRPPVGYPPFACYTFAEAAPPNETVP